MIYITAVAIYVALLMVVSLMRSSRIKNQEDFMVAGRKVPTVLLIGTLVCTWIGSGSLFGGAGRAFREGFSALWMSAGAWLGLVIVYFLAPKVRRIAQYTVADILEKRYNQSARLLGSLAVIIAYLTIASYQFNGGGRLLHILTNRYFEITERTLQKLQRESQPISADTLQKLETIKNIHFGKGQELVDQLRKTIGEEQTEKYKSSILKHSSTGLDHFYGKLITCIFVVIVTMAAGMVSIVAMDIFNGILITLGILIAVPFIYTIAGGWPQIVSNLNIDPQYPHYHFSIFGRIGLLSAMGLFLPTFFLLLGESSMYQKFFSAKDEKSARNAVLGMIVGVVVVEVSLAAVAIFGGSLYTKDPAFVHTAGQKLQFLEAQTESIIIQVAVANLPMVIGILVLCAAVAIIVSTANTFLMIPSTNLTRDVYQRFINPTASQKTIVWLQRLLIPILAILAFVVSTFFKTILDMALYAYTMVGAAVTPALLAAFLWKRVTVVGGASSIAVGMITTAVFACLKTIGIIHIEYDYIIFPAAGASITTLIVVSLLTTPSPKEKWEPFLPDTIAEVK